MSITLAEGMGRGRGGRQAVLSMAGCHPALVLPDGHCCVTEPRHNSATSSSDTTWFLLASSFPAVPVEKGGCDSGCPWAAVLSVKLHKSCSVRACGWALLEPVNAWRPGSGGHGFVLLHWYEMKSKYS